MVQAITEIAAMCVGIVGLIGAAATTGLPMWKVTAFIGENIIVMETRWEGLWMNCFRQANIRMQCKVYDSLLFLPPDLQAARGLMCCSVALSGLGLLVALAGLHCISCIRDNLRAKAIILMVAGGMQLLAALCVFIPVSWTGHVIIRDFYNPLLIDAQRRELGEALYIGWVTGGILFASGILFVCRRVPPNGDSFDLYKRGAGFRKPTLMRYHPISSVPSVRPHTPQPVLQNPGPAGPQEVPLVQTVPLTPNGTPTVYIPTPGSVLYPDGSTPYISTQSSNLVSSLSTPGNSLYLGHQNSPYTLSYRTHPSMSYNSSFYPVPQNPVFIGYSASKMHPRSNSGSSPGMYI